MQIIVDNLVTEYSDAGQGDVVLLLHGWGDKKETFNQLSAYLAKQYRVIALDLPGFGKSQAPKIAWNLDDYSDFLEKFLVKIKLQTIHATIGHSNGGALLIRAVSLGNLNANKYVLLAASGIRDQNRLKRITIGSLAKIGKVLTIWLPLSLRQKLQKILYGSVGSDALAVPHMRETFKLTVVQDVSSDAKKINKPSLLIYAKNDRAVPIWIGHKYHDLISSSKLVSLDTGGHFLHQTQSERVINEIEEFLK